MLSIGSKLKELSEHSLIYGLGSAMQSLLTFLLIPIYTFYFTVEEYGAISLIILIGSIIGTIFYFGISGSLSRSYYDYDDESDRRKVVSTSLLLTIIGASIQIFLVYFYLNDFLLFFLEITNIANIFFL